MRTPCRKIRISVLLAVAVLAAGTMLTACPLSVRATETEEVQEDELMREAEVRRRLPVQSDATPGWPDGPAISAQAAILMEVHTGTILYAKNIHEHLAPASTTKILTCLLAVENARPSDTIEFSHDAVFSLPEGSSNIGIDPGEALTLEQALYGILVGSANEVSNAVGEHVGGSIPEFVGMMNERAKALGCTDSHFANTNGLPVSSHYTSAHDLALIARAFFDVPLLARISGTATYHFAKTDRQKDDFVIRNKHKLVNGEIPCEGLVGGKTGYTDAARETLVTCAEQDGMRLVCVVLKEENPSQFTDTVTLFDYGFHNFRVARASEERRFLPEDLAFAASPFDIFGSSRRLLTFDTDDIIVLPAGIGMDETETELTYGGESFAQVAYSWHGISLGRARIIRSSPEEAQDDASPAVSAPGFVTVRLFRILPVVYGAAGAFCLISVVVSLIRSYHFGIFSVSERKRYRQIRRERKHERLRIDK